MSPFLKKHRWYILVWLILLVITATAWTCAQVPIPYEKTQLSTDEKIAPLTSQKSPPETHTDPQVTVPVQKKIDSTPITNTVNHTTSPETTGTKVKDVIVYTGVHKNDTPAPPTLATSTLIVNGNTYETAIPRGDTVLGLMTKISTEKGLQFIGKEYGDLGIFIEEIDGTANNPRAGTYWVYYINHTRAPLGVSNYILKPNDTIEWKYEKIF